MVADSLLAAQALLIGTVMFALTLVLHVLWWRTFPLRHGLFLLLGTAAIIGIIASAVLWSVGTPSLVLAISMPVYGCALLAYLHLYIGTDRSLSMRILSELATAGGSMTPSALDAVYSLTYMYRSRLDLLERNKWMTKDGDGGYTCTGKGRFFAAIIRALRSLYGVTRAG